MRVVVLFLACAALAACGSTAHPVASTGPASAATTPTPPASAPSSAAAPTTTMSTATAPAPASTPVTASSPTTTAPAPSTGLCTAPELSLSVLSQQGAAGHGVIALALRNTSGHVCHTYGFPGVLFLDAGGAALATDPTHVTSDFVGSVPERPLTLDAGQRASFRLVVSHGSATPGSCHTAQGLQVIPPDDTQTLRTDLSGGVTECGAVTVSPVTGGTTADPS